MRCQLSLILYSRHNVKALSLFRLTLIWAVVIKRFPLFFNFPFLTFFSAQWEVNVHENTGYMLSQLAVKIYNFFIAWKWWYHHLLKAGWKDFFYLRIWYDFWVHSFLFKWMDYISEEWEHKDCHSFDNFLYFYWILIGKGENKIHGIWDIILEFYEHFCEIRSQYIVNSFFLSLENIDIFMSSLKCWNVPIFIWYKQDMLHIFLCHFDYHRI